jgi:23S rRNA pseudouridine955/2504/2580 synthase
MSSDVRQFIVGADDDGIRLDRWFKRHLRGPGSSASMARAPIRATASPPAR